MKKIVLTLLSGLFISLVSLAQNYTVTVYGNVMFVVDGIVSPVPDQEVIIKIDSSNSGFTYQNTVLTDESGYYEDVIDIPGFSGYEFVQAMTLDPCLGQYQYNGQFIAPGTTLIPMDFFLCDTIQPECQASFYYYQVDPIDPYTFAFENMSFGNYTQVFWEFGDSTYSSEPNPVHTFQGEGTYNVCLTISDGTICNSTYCEFVYTGGGMNGCENYFMYYNTTNELFTVTFEGFLLNGQDAQSYFWDFGDGTTGEGQIVSHTYPEGQGNFGIYMVGLSTMVMDSMGDSCFYTSYQEVWLDTLNQGGCSNFFTYEQSDSLTFTFSGMVYLNNGAIYPDSATVYTWEFGDGTTGTGQTITHTYEGNPSGGFTVCLVTSTILPDGTVCSTTYCEGILWGPPAFSIYGTVYLENNLLADQAVVHLLSMDTTWQGVIEVQSTTIDSGGFYSFPDISMYNSRIYYIQAELTEGSAYFGQYLPTYHINSLNWEAAMPILPLMNWPADIFMIAGSTVDGGNGVISGIVSDLGSRGYMDDVEVVLMDSGQNPLTYLLSDDQGAFNFENLTLGTYIIHAEIMGIHTIQAQVNLSDEQPVANVEIQVSGGEANVVFGVPEQKVTLEKVGDIYPNPLNETAKLDITVKKPVNLEISIFAQTGQLMQVNEMFLNAGMHNIGLETGSLPVGLYLLRITTSQGEQLSRKFMKIQ